MMPKLPDLPNKLAAATKQGAGGRGEASRIRRTSSEVAGRAEFEGKILCKVL